MNETESVMNSDRLSAGMENLTDSRFFSLVKIGKTRQVTDPYSAEWEAAVLYATLAAENKSVLTFQV